ncbi:uncharacterized protein SCHCODRAFT_02619371 [Schizophyllum commune H4-8]|uniref:uncharacterized protein n=1 Tax=Schizophyllum commune (strain H4-8 / FGSC 9210) TaxID=578458 RepID=UPI002160A047|nr:uncharacterized protein SCHCODRAFT_02619371 [Schizophyllum commune H4-8]KAI5895422.1 hypothetical protein SCHCODRAFT_02619371 [Schizophyllum commune H4-8]
MEYHSDPARIRRACEGPVQCEASAGVVNLSCSHKSTFDTTVSHSSFLVQLGADYCANDVFVAFDARVCTLRLFRFISASSRHENSLCLVLLLRAILLQDWQGNEEIDLSTARSITVVVKGKASTTTLSYPASHCSPRAVYRPVLLSPNSPAVNQICAAVPVFLAESDPDEYTRY